MPRTHQMHGATRILLADKDRLMRLGLRSMLERESGFAVVAEASSGNEAVDAAKQCRPEVAILAVRLAEMDGIEAASRIAKSSPNTAVLIVSMFDDEQHVRLAARSGAQGYVLKTAEKQELIKAVQSVSRGGIFASMSVREFFEEAFKRKHRPGPLERFDLLTDRERQVHLLLVEGRTTKEIAHNLGLSVRTVDTHRSHIMNKLGVHSLAELILDAARRGFIR